MPVGREGHFPCKWIYRVKFNPNGSISKYKPALVEKGDGWKKWIDYKKKKTFNTVAKLAIGATERIHLAQFDMSTAFLSGQLEGNHFYETTG